MITKINCISNKIKIFEKFRAENFDSKLACFFTENHWNVTYTGNFSSGFILKYTVLEWQFDIDELSTGLIFWHVIIFILNCAALKLFSS